MKNKSLISLSGSFFPLYSFCHLAYFIWGKKIISKTLLCISWSKGGWRSYICIPSGAQKHLIAHTKGELQARLRNFLCTKTILKTVKNSQSVKRLNIQSLLSLKLLYLMSLNILLQILKLLLEFFSFK